MRRLNAIDGLRGLAALAVLVYHSRSSFWVGINATYREHGLAPNLNAWIGYLTAPFSFGGLGVTLFFVLSGYCIHRRGARNLATKEPRDLNLAKFASRRFWRIFPTYVCALLFTALIDYWLQAMSGHSVPNQDNSVSTFLISLLTLQGYAAPSFGSNGVFWTLAMEIHLYVMYPLLYALSFRIGPVRVLAFTFFISLLYTVCEMLFGFESLLTNRCARGPIFLPYWFTWTMGFYLAEVEAGRCRDAGDKAWFSASVVAIPIGVYLSLMNNYLLAEIFWSIAFASLLRTSLSPLGERIWQQGIGKLLANIGVFSYSLYAVHAPLLLMFHQLISPGDPNYKYETLWMTLAGVVVSVVFAYVFFQLVERWSIPKKSGIGIKLERLA
ncbi:MAG: acyltransferase [Pirellula sp.]